MAYTNGKEFKNTVHEKMGALGVNAKYQNVLGIVAWNGYEPKYDLRRWKDDAPTKGIAINPEEMQKLKAILKGIDDFEGYLGKYED